ncbi:hypothetical protein N1851_002144 [Merluccius polli]|uniref:Uncharacterized protein n=1 Tax=Merluccius polli TaxID=89951 RepID=A0AA47NBQ3_MERPO|nr:hypothetical protein N1851_002144 [Merluccius polli]
METRRLCFTIGATYDVLTTQVNLHQRLGEDPGLPQTHSHRVSSQPHPRTHYTWHHNQVLKSLASTLENKLAATNSLQPAASNSLRTTTFVTRSDWKLLVDIGRQLVFPPEIATVTLRPDLSSSLSSLYPGRTLAYERKHLCYAELAAEAQHRGWNNEVRPVELGCRGLTRLLGDLGIRGLSHQSWGQQREGASG